MPELIKYLWYIKVPGDEQLEQGDFITKCPILEPLSEMSVRKEIDADVREYDVIIMSQSCDIVQEKIDLVLLCPFTTLTKFSDDYPEYKSEEMKEEIRKGNVTGLHLLSKDIVNGLGDHLIVSFKSVYALPLSVLKKIAVNQGERLRLLPPYREHLSQAFARFFMRVGLPIDIPKFC